jgi:hypothetical protein
MTTLRTAALAVFLCALWFAPQIIQRTNDPCNALARFGWPVTAKQHPMCVVTYWWITIDLALAPHADTAPYADVE